VRAIISGRYSSYRTDSFGSFARVNERSQSRDRLLVKKCLSGSERAWREFYTRFIGLMRSVVTRRTDLPPEDVEDVTQSAFLVLATRLDRYDFRQSLPRFVGLITERAVVDEYRKRSAAKRISPTDKIEYEDRLFEGTEFIDRGSKLQDERMELAQRDLHVRAALHDLDPECREVLKLRFFDELSYGEIAEAVGANENTVTVRTRRCLDKLRSKIGRFRQRGSIR